MKKIIIFSLLALSLSSCNDFLDLYPESQASTGGFYKTQSDFNAAVVACYSSLRSYPTNNVFPLIEHRSDNLYMKSFTTGNQDQWQVNKFIDNSSNSLTAVGWNDMYNGIFNCNQVISRIADVTFDEDKKKQYEGEARFIRGFYYFTLVRLFGGLPLVDKSVTAAEAYRIPRSSVESTYKFIEDDLTKAITLLPETYATADLGRVRASAAKVLLAKVYLTQAKYNSAQTLLKEVIDNSATLNYQLLPAIADVFSVTKEMNNEVVFAIRYSKTLSGGGHSAWFNLSDPTTSIVNSGLLNSYNSTDARANLVKYTKSGSVYYMNKFFDSLDATTQTVGNDFIVLRYADVLLMYAECLNETSATLSKMPDDTNGALYWLNLVRKRSDPTQLIQAAQFANKDELRALIIKERLLEFPLEGNRWFDLVRTKTANAVMSVYPVSISDATKISVPDYRLIYPIPNAEVEKVNNPEILPQNPEY
jgi:hypothetical protein